MTTRETTVEQRGTFLSPARSIFCLSVLANLILPQRGKKVIPDGLTLDFIEHINQALHHCGSSLVIYMF